MYLSDRYFCICIVNYCTSWLGLGQVLYTVRGNACADLQPGLNKGIYGLRPHVKKDSNETRRLGCHRCVVKQGRLP